MCLASQGFILIDDEVSGEIPETSIDVSNFFMGYGPVAGPNFEHTLGRRRTPHCCQTSLDPFQYASLRGYDLFLSVGALVKRPEFLGFLGDVAAWPPLGLAVPRTLLARADQVIE